VNATDVDEYRLENVYLPKDEKDFENTIELY